MLDPLTTQLLERCSLVVGTVGYDGEPYATRGWGLKVVDPETGRLRLLLAADDEQAIACLHPGGVIAITGADVRTLRSVQLKGTSLGIEPSTGEDRDHAERFIEAFFGDIVASDSTPRVLLDRLVPLDYVTCVVAVDALYDQTPGPGAGTALTRGER